MEIYKCPICNKKYAVEDRFSISNAFANGQFICENCGGECKHEENNVVDNTEHDNDTYMNLVKEQVKTLKSIEKMTRFFYRLAWVGIVFSIIYWLFVLAS